MAPHPDTADTGSRLALERTVLAHERTELAWVRTAISLISFGFSIVQFFSHMRPNRPNALIGPDEFGFTMMVIGLFTLLLSAWQHNRAMRLLRERYPVSQGYPELPRSNARILAGLIGILGLIGLLSMLTRR